MSLIGNIIWFLLGGLEGGLMWLVAGVACCITIVGIPLGCQCFKFSSIAFFPFGKEIVWGGGVVSFLANFLWVIFFGWWMALYYLALGCLYYITIVGIPIAKYCFRMAKLSFKPFGARVKAK